MGAGDILLEGAAHREGRAFEATEAPEPGARRNPEAAYGRRAAPIL